MKVDSSLRHVSGDHRREGADKFDYSDLAAYEVLDLCSGTKCSRELRARTCI